MENVKLIDKQLLNLYGKTVDNKSKFRLVWSGGLLEQRHGTFTRYAGNVYLGEHTGRELCKKYSYIKDRFILERYAPEANSNPEIDSDGYEPLYVFQADNGDYLVPRLDVCQIYINAYLAIKNGEVQKKNAKMIETEDSEQFDKDVKEIEEALMANCSSPLMSQFHDGEAIIIHRKDN